MLQMFMGCVRLIYLISEGGVNRARILAGRTADNVIDHAKVPQRERIEQHFVEFGCVSRIAVVRFKYHHILINPATKSFGY